ncbi:PaaI family thioesterase [Nocardia sp. R16R-3T]
MDNGIPSLPPIGGDETRWKQWAEALPVSQQLGLRCVRLEAGELIATLASSPWPLNPNGAVHGGLIAAGADHCFGIVAVNALDGSATPATATLSVDYLRPGFAPLTFEATVDRRGRTLVFITVMVRSADGRVCARVGGTMALSATREPGPDVLADVPADSATA